MPELIARAFAVATSGRPGPVVVALPEDMLASEVDVPDAAPHRPLAGPAPADGDMARLGELLAQARAPLAIVGEGGWTAQTGADVAAFAEAQARAGRRLVPLPGLRRQRLARLRRATPGWRMDPALAKRIREADLLLAIGGRLGEIPTAGYTLVRPGAPTQRLVHVHPDPDEIGAVYPTELGIVAGLEAFAAAARGARAGGRRPRAPACSRPRAASTSATSREARELPGPLQMSAVMATLRERLPAEAILTNGAGNFSVWAHRYYEFHRYPTQLGPRSGSMGYGVPAAVGAPRPCTPTARSSASPATATSS